MSLMNWFEDKHWFGGLIGAFIQKLLLTDKVTFPLLVQWIFSPYFVITMLSESKAAWLSKPIPLIHFSILKVELLDVAY
jgi:hypothetical protein